MHLRKGWPACESMHLPCAPRILRRTTPPAICRAVRSVTMTWSMHSQVLAQIRAEHGAAPSPLGSTGAQPEGRATVTATADSTLLAAGATQLTANEPHETLLINNQRFGTIQMADSITSVQLTAPPATSSRLRPSQPALSGPSKLGNTFAPDGLDDTSGHAAHSQPRPFEWMRTNWLSMGGAMDPWWLLTSIAFSWFAVVAGAWQAGAKGGTFALTTTERLLQVRRGKCI